MSGLSRPLTDAAGQDPEAAKTLHESGNDGPAIRRDGAMAVLDQLATSAALGRVGPRTRLVMTPIPVTTAAATKAS